MCTFVDKMGYYIKDIYIDSKVILAPMAGVTNIAYRKMCKRYGAGMVTTEMISDKGIFYHDKKTKDMASIDDNEHPVAIQIFGGEIDTLINAAKWVDEQTNADIIDINMGCPVPKVLKSDAGSKYLLDVERIYNTVKNVVENVKKPVTVKIRIGWDHNSINVFEVSDAIIKAGASALVIHGRTKSDLYSGTVNYDIIKQVKERHPDFPIIANGDINLNNEKIDISFKPFAGKLTDTNIAKALSSLVKLTGTISNPSVGIDGANAIKTFVGVTTAGPVYLGAQMLVESDGSICYTALEGTGFEKRFPEPKNVVQSTPENVGKALNDSVDLIKDTTKGLLNLLSGTNNNKAND